jgi:16S rRNA (guanine527-N7)-methyltransferase
MPQIPLHIDRILRSNGLSLDEVRSERMAEFAELLLEWNQKINLVSRRDADKIWESHILHSLTPLFLFDIPEHTQLLDLGTGGGLPGIPLSIAHGALDVALIDSIQKKTRVLEDIIKRIGLTNLRVFAGRAEELGRRKPLRGAFDAVIARAVAPLPELVEWSRPFLRKRQGQAMKVKGEQVRGKSEITFPYLLALKGGDLVKEIHDARVRSRGITITEIALTFPGSDLLGLVDKKVVLVEWPD